MFKRPLGEVGREEGVLGGVMLRKCELGGALGRHGKGGGLGGCVGEVTCPWGVASQPGVKL